MEEKLVGSIRYAEKEGRLTYSYYEYYSLPETPTTRYIIRKEGTVSKKIVSQGKQAVERYIQRTIGRYVTQRIKEIHKEYAWLSDINFPIETAHDGALLKGKIVSATGSTLHITLDEPYEGEIYVHFGFGSRPIFSGKHEFSEYALKAARERLTWIYEKEHRRATHPDVVNLVDSLNKDQE